MGTATPARSTWASPRGPFPHATNPAAPTGIAAVYRRRQPTATPLYPIVQHHLETFLARAAQEDPLGDGLPGWVEEDFRAYLRCGILAHGFARTRCDDCAAERLVAFSCSMPSRIRSFYPHDPALAGAVLRVLLRAIRTTLRSTSAGAGPDSQLGAVSFLHRFGSALNRHFHFHVVVLDGLSPRRPTAA